jgi:hypothetical protein
LPSLKLEGSEDLPKHSYTNQKTWLPELLWGKLLRDRANTHPPVSRLNVIPEKGGKYRVANVADVATNARAGPLGDQVISVLKRHPAIKGEFDNRPDYNAKRLFENRTRPIERKFYSTDMNQSTDTINKEVIYRVVNSLSVALRWTREQHECAMRTVRPMNLYVKKENEHEMWDELVGKNTTGTLLGLPLSFAVLCIVHLYCVDAMSDIGKRRTIIYGDDMATYCSTKDWELYVQRCHSVGFTLNMSKTHIAEYGFVFCGKIYSVVGNKCHWIRAIKLSIVTGSSGAKKNLVEQITQAAEASHVVQQWQADRLLSIFKKRHQVLTNRCRDYGIPFVGPIIGGALGFRGRCDQRTRKVATYNSKIEYNPFSRIFSQIQVPKELLGAMHDAYTEYERIREETRLTTPYKLEKRMRGEEITPYDANQLEEFLLSNYLYHASIDVRVGKFERKSSNRLSKMLRKLTTIRSLCLKNFEENRSDLCIPRSPSYQFMSKSLRNGNRFGWRLDAEAVGKYLNQLPCRKTWKDNTDIPNFDLERHRRSLRREPVVHKAHSILTLKY